MKTAWSFVLAVLLTSCGQSENKAASDTDSGLLSPTLVQNAATASGADTAVLGRMPVIHFTDTAHDFGAIREGEVLEYRFAFRNTGKSPLLIAGTETSCGCTASDFPRDPIAPGAGGAITVRFKSEGKTGYQDKTVTLSTNAAPPVPQLRITADVQPRNP